MFVALALSLSTTDAEAAEARHTTPWRDPVAEEVAAGQVSQEQFALDRYELGARRVRTGLTLLPVGAAIGTVGAGAFAIGMLGAYAGGDPLLVTGLMVGGGVGVIAGAGMVVASPFYVGRGLALERRALADLGADAPGWAERAALGSALVTPLFPIAGVGAVAFSLVQQNLNHQALRSVQVTPTVRPDGGGVEVSGRF